VTYLLDVNVMLSLRYVHHVHHDRTICWLRNLETWGAPARFASCSTTELGFVRIAGNRNSGLADNVAAAQEDLLHLKEDFPFVFLTDPLGADHLPLWVERCRQVTDGHLLALANVNGMKFATLDRGIPGALLIPEQPNEPMVVREPTIPYGAGTHYSSHVN